MALGVNSMEGGERSGELGPGRLVRLWVLPTGQQDARHSGSVQLYIARGPKRSARRAEGARQEVATAFQEGEMGWDWAGGGILHRR